MKFLDEKYVKFLIVFLIMSFFLVISFGIYNSYKKNYDGDKLVINNYYSSSFLFNNGYIRVADDISLVSDEKSDFYMYLNNDNILNIKYKLDDKEFSKEVFGLPLGELKIYYNKFSLNCLEVAGLSGNDFYYNNFCLDDKNISDFEKISTSVRDVYVPSFDKKGVYVINDDSIKSNFIVNTTLDELKYISSKDNVLGLYNDVDKVKPYFDYICFGEGIDLCNNTMVYLNFNNELVFNYGLENSIKNESLDSLIVQDVFGTFKIDSDKSINYDELNFENLNRYEYLFVIYILDKENNFYVVNVDKNDILNKKVNNAFKYSNEKVNKIDYVKDDSDSITKVVITFVDGSTEEIKGSNNFKIVKSTTSDRNLISNGILVK